MRTRQPNPVRLEGDTAHLALNRGLETRVDSVDLPLVGHLRWTAAFHPGLNGYYVSTSVPSPATGRSTTLYLHRLITGAPKGKTVDHLNHDTLDNRRANLSVGGQRENLQNRRGANTNSTTGMRGVHVHSTVAHRKSRQGTRTYSYTYWNARVMRDGRSRTKNFPYTPAGFAAACAWVAAERGET